MSLRLAVNFRSVDPSRGGAETYVADLVRHLIHAGHSVDLFAESWAQGVLPPETVCHHVPAPGRSRASKIRGFATASEAALQGQSYDCTVGFINTWFTDVLIPQGGVHKGSLEANARRFPAGWRRSAYLAAKRLNPKAGLYREIERRQYDPDHGARLVVAVSRMVRSHLERFHGLPSDRVRIVPNAIDASRLDVSDPSATRRAFRQERGLADKDLTALFVGHNFRLKGLAPLLRSLRLRLDHDPRARPIHLLVCGGGRVAPFREMVRRLGLEKVVHLIGFADDIRAPFHAADFFCLPTYYDPCSLVVFEALACGLPVITTARNGASDVMTPGREGFIVPEPDDLTELVKALEAMTDDASRQFMAEAARRLGREQSFERHAARLVEVFQEVADQKRRPLSSSRLQARRPTLSERGR